MKLYFDGSPVASADDTAFEAYVKRYGFAPPNAQGLASFVQEARAKQVLKYKDGSTASPKDSAERNVFRAFYQITGCFPQSRNALLLWACKNNPKEIQKILR